MPSSYSQIVIEPPLQEWKAQRSITHNADLSKLRDAARRRIVDTSRQFVVRLHDIARSSGLSEATQPLLTGDPDQQAIVMTGHQPTIFHPGIVFKYEQTQLFAHVNQTIGLAIVIDTDQGDPGTFPYPAAEAEAEHALAVTTRFDSMGRGATLFPACQLKSESELAQAAHNISNTISVAAGEENSQAFAAVAEEYGMLNSVPTMEANLIVRRRHGIGSRLLELPLSAFSVFPESSHIAAGILSRAMEFASLHNKLLAEFRAEEKIRNDANPFPDLAVDTNRCEIPFWILDLPGTRRRVAAVRRAQDGWELLADDECILTWTDELTWQNLQSLTAHGVQLVPRGAMITALMRLLISDLFVHGTGGAKYDRFTDRLLQHWWQFTPTPFVVASGSRFLLSRQKARLEHLDAVAAQLRELSHNPQRFLGTGIFSDSQEQLLQVLIDEKQTAVEQLKRLRATGQSGRNIGTRIQQLSQQIREAVEAVFAPQMQELNSISRENRSTITSRTWPWFLFSDPIAF